MKRLFIGFILLFACVAVLLSLPRRFFWGDPYTDDSNKILNRLRDIDAAKTQWGAAHPGVKVTELSQHDLSAYLNADFWKKSVAGEIYLIHGTYEPPEALMTRDVEWIAKGKKLRFGPDGKVEIRPNTALEPTPTAP